MIKPLPHDLDAERDLLGAMMLSADACGSVNGLTSGDFYKPAHGHVFDAVKALRASGSAAEPTIVADHLGRLGLLDVVGGREALAEIMAGAPSTSAAADYAAIIARKAEARRYIALAGELTRSGQSEDLTTARRLVADALTETAPGGVTRRAAAGGDWLLDQPPGIPAVWGADDEVLWAQGEALMVVGPSGVGKTTLGGQLVMARLGLRIEVLGWPVTEAKRILYLAMDRPAQVRRAMARLVFGDERDVLNERFVVHEGPPPYDLARHPHILTEMAAAEDADCVFVDSLKDAALGLTDDDVGAGYNRARQTALTEGIEVIELHHQRKGQNGVKPKTLEDVYGSTWLTAGAGSVVLLWGQPGDQLVELTHLKQPGAIVGPHQIAHDHAAGTSAIEGRFDILTYLRRQPSGTDADSAARARYSTSTPSENQRRTARRQLDRLVVDGLARKIAAIEGGPTGTQPARWYPVDDRREEF